MLETDIFTEYIIIGVRNGLIIGGITSIIAEGINLVIKLFNKS